jgi:hypothetical protein
MTRRNKSIEPYGIVMATKLPEALDRRRKIPTAEHDPIRKAWAEGEAIRAIARRYGVDKRLIQFIVHPERLEAQRKRKKAQRYSQKYYHENTKGEKWAETMREHRAYKQMVLKANG